MQAEIVFALAAIIGETAARDRLRRLPDPIAGAQGHRKTVEDTQRLNVLARPAQDARPHVPQQFPHRLGTTRKAAVLGKMRKETRIGSPYLTQPGPLTLYLTQFA